MHSLFRLIARRIVVLPLVLLAVAAMTFTLIALSPFDPISAYVAGTPGLSAEEKQRIAHAWGFDQPAYMQFVHWITNVLHGDLGYSRILGGQPVAEQIAARMLPTAILIISATALMIIGGLIAGIIAARFADSWIDTLIRSASYFSISAPPFWTGLILLWVFSLALGWFPAGATADLRNDHAPVIEIQYLVLPAVALAATQFAWFAMFVRDQLLEVVNDEYVLFAHAQGIRPLTVIVRHALPNALLPFLTLSGVQLSEMIGGTVLVETVFDWPGLGQLAVVAAKAVDVPLLLGITLLGSVAVVLGNLAADICYYIVDPRIRESR